MDHPILFNPDNRLLGSATGDLGMYGGQSDPQFSVRHAQDGQLAEAGSGETPSQSAPVAPVVSDLASGNTDPSVVADSGETGPGASSPTAFVIASPVTSFQPVEAPIHSDGLTPFVSEWHPVVHGAGSTIPSIPALSQTDAASSSAAVEAAHGTLDGVVTGTAANLLDDLVGSSSAATGLSPIADTVDGVLSTTIGAVDDTLEGLAGSDPLGGVATLVNLVSVSDMFDLNPVDAPLVDASGDAGLGMLDALVGEELASDALLGTHHEDGLLGGDHLDHPLGL